MYEVFIWWIRTYGTGLKLTFGELPNVKFFKFKFSPILTSHRLFITYLVSDIHTECSPTVTVNHYLLPTLNFFNFTGTSTLLEAHSQNSNIFLWLYYFNAVFYRTWYNYFQVVENHIQLEWNICFTIKCLPTLPPLIYHCEIFARLIYFWNILMFSNISCRRSKF